MIEATEHVTGQLFYISPLPSTGQLETRYCYFGRNLFIEHTELAADGGAGRAIR